MKNQVQIHIAGCKRSGKTTLARNLAPLLEQAGYRSIICDVDEVKNRIFGAEKVMAALPDTPESLEMQSIAIETLFTICIPMVLILGGSPIIVMTHLRRTSYYRGRDIAAQYSIPFKFLLVKAPTLEEAKLRAQHIRLEDQSDMRNFNNPKIVQSFLLYAKKIEGVYENFSESYMAVEQADPQEMAMNAFDYIARSS